MRPISLAGDLGELVSVLLDQDLVAHDPAEAGHQAFNAEIKRVLNELIPTLGVGNATPSPDDMAALSGQIGEKVRSAIPRKATSRRTSSPGSTHCRSGDRLIRTGRVVTD